MKLKSFGCSFIYGTDLRDDNRHGPYTNPSKLSWPALLAQDLDREYICHARPGSGNLRIAEKIMSEVSYSDSKDLFVIGWTWIDRFDYTSFDNTWMTVTPGEINDHAKFYYKNLHSQYKDKLMTLIYIKTAIDILKNKGIPFIMTYIDDLIWEDTCHATTAVTDTQTYIRPYISSFEGKTFLEFTQHHGFEISSTSHPLERAHQRAFEVVRDNLDQYIKT